VRYFLVSIVFLLLLGSRLLARLAERGAWGRLAYAVVLLAILSANGVHLVGFLRDGRGHYRQALHYMADHTRGPMVTIGGDHDLRNHLVVDFYARELAPHKQVVYFEQAAWPRAGTEWFLMHSQSSEYQPPAALVVQKVPYALAASYPYAELSGWRWFVYHQTGHPFEPRE
jgi:hypothetical protein